MFIASNSKKPGPQKPVIKSFEMKNAKKASKGFCIPRSYNAKADRPHKFTSKYTIKLPNGEVQSYVVCSWCEGRK